MSFKCSVFGHAYGDPEIEREREEDGSEVITTIRETQICKRCGEERVVSENKEVTTLETAADIVADDLAEDNDASEPAGPPEGSDDPVPEPPTSEADDATILDAETGDDVATDDPESVESDPEPVETDPEDDDGVILEEDEEPEPEREPGEWPEEPQATDDDWKPETEIDPTPDDERTVEPTGAAVTVPDGEFYCPECEFRTPVRESSHREGDFCPECHRGSLEHVSE